MTWRLIAWGDTITDKSNDYYVVQVMWPDMSDDGNGTRKWGTYYRTGFNDIRNPRRGASPWSKGTFEEMNADVSDVPERIDNSGMHFTCPIAALRYAERLKEFGRPQAGWEGNETWRLKYREPVDTRVIWRKVSEIERIVIAAT
jgi:hypothetical protein